MFSVERQFQDYKEVKIKERFGPRTGIQQITKFQYVCNKCDNKETFDIPKENWKCKNHEGVID